MKRRELLEEIEIQKENKRNRPQTAKNWYYTIPCMGVSPNAKKIKAKKNPKPKLKSGCEHWQTTNQFYQKGGHAAARPNTANATYRG